MSSLYLDRKNTSLKIRDGALVIYRDGRQQSTLPLKMLERIVLRADIGLSASVLAELGARGIALTVLGGRRGDKVAQLTGSQHNDAARRLAQYRVFNDSARRLAQAREIITAKLHNQQRFIETLLDARPDQRLTLTKSQKVIQQALSDTGSANAIENLLGYEGAAASAAFTALQAVLPPRLGFSGRNRRPPRDPVNACLSLAYTLAHSDAFHACHRAGLDPAVGMLHETAFGRASLAADLIEPLRPHIDEWVWNLFRQRRLDTPHFSSEENACLLKKNGRQIFYGEWEERAPAMRRWLRQRSHALVRQITGAENETPSLS